MSLLDLIKQRLTLIGVRLNPAVGFTAEQLAKMNQANELIRQVAEDMYRRDA